MNTDQPKRILLVDDNASIHEDFKVLLGYNDLEDDALTSSLEEDLFSDLEDEDDESLSISPTRSIPKYRIDDAYQGEEAIKMVDQSIADDYPYSLIFMDVRMPPGIDGIQTIKRIWAKHPLIEIVICTAYSDYSWDQIVSEFGDTDHLLFMKKPFDSVTVQQTTLTLIRKWELDQLNRQNLELMNQKIAERNSELNRILKHLEILQKQAQEATIAKSKFLTSMSNELRTPLNGIMGMTELLLDTNLSNEQKDYTETIKYSGDSLLTVINDFLDYTKLQSGKIEFEEIDFSLRTTIESVIEFASIEAHKKGLEIASFVKGNIPDTLVGDPGRLRHLLISILNCAIKRTDSGEIILIVSTLEGQSATASHKISLMFEIKDTSAGMSQNEIRRIEEYVPQKDLSDEGYGDFEIGLSIARQICTLMGGSLVIDSVMDKGTNVKFNLNYNVNYQIITNYSLNSNTINNVKSLIIGDNSTSRKVLSLYMSHWGSTSFEATSFEQALPILKEHQSSDVPISLVLVDFKRGDLDTYKSTAIRIHAFNPQLHLICLTSRGIKGDSKLIQSFGYKAYLTNPIKQSQLYYTILLLQSDRFTKSDETPIITKHFVEEIIQERYKILVVDDDFNNQHLLVKMIEKVGAICDIEESSKGTLHAWEKNKYDLIFINYVLPDSKCTEVARSIRQLENEHEHVSIIALLDETSEDIKKSCYDAGIDSTLDKPIKTDLIIETLQSFLTKGKRQLPKGV